VGAASLLTQSIAYLHDHQVMTQSFLHDHQVMTQC